jgi:hypothetical protein
LPAGIIAKLNKEINATVVDPEMKARLADLGGTVLVDRGRPSGAGLCGDGCSHGLGVPLACRRATPKH